jgi:hypothetical protein
MVNSGFRYSKECVVSLLKRGNDRMEHEHHDAILKETDVSDLILKTAARHARRFGY